MIRLETHGEITTLRMARRLPGLPPYFTAAHLVHGLLVDSGCAHATAELLRTCRREGLRPHTVVNTHRHEDHIAGNAALQRRFGARVLAHPLALPVLADPRGRQPMQLYRRLMWGYPEPSRAEPLQPGETVEAGAHRFAVIHTPGHSPDHICLHQPEQGWLFCGDAYVGGEDRGLRVDSDVWQVIASLRKLVALEPRLLFPGSGSVNRSPVPSMQRKIDYLEQLGQRVLQLHRRGWSLAHIRQHLFGREPAFFRVTAGDFNGINLVRSFVENAPGVTRR